MKGKAAVARSLPPPDARARADGERELELEGPLDLGASLGPLLSGSADPTARLAESGLVRATRTPEGPATLFLECSPRPAHAERVRIRARAWGDGAGWVLERVPDLVGSEDRPQDLADVPPPMRHFAKRARGLRLARTHRVVEALTLLVIQQKVTGKEAKLGFAKAVRRFSEPAPGPFDGLRLPLSPDALRTLPAWSFPPLGILPPQGETLRRLGLHAGRLEETHAFDTESAARRLLAVPGIGRWTAASALLFAMGHADAVPVGDAHIPSVVAFTLGASEAEARAADDRELLERLEPYRGQRGRVLRWILASARTPPRRGPRRALRAHY